MQEKNLTNFNKPFVIIKKKKPSQKTRDKGNTPTWRQSIYKAPTINFILKDWMVYPNIQKQGKEVGF